MKSQQTAEDSGERHVNHRKFCFELHRSHIPSSRLPLCLWLDLLLLPLVPPLRIRSLWSDLILLLLLSLVPRPESGPCEDYSVNESLRPKCGILTIQP